MCLSTSDASFILRGEVTVLDECCARGSLSLALAAPPAAVVECGRIEILDFLKITTKVQHMKIM
jgi:hypothetical protein